MRRAKLRRALSYWRRKGLLRTVGAALMYSGRKLDRTLNLRHLDDMLGIQDGFMSGPRVGDWLKDYTVSEDAIAHTSDLNERWLRQPGPIRSALWVMPDFRSVHNGGPNTILRFAHHLAGSGIHNTLVIFNGHIHRTARSVKREIAEAFGSADNIDVVVNPVWKPLTAAELPDSDVAIATIWQSAYVLLPYRRTRAKFYFVQDYERFFYPAGIESGLADQTYDFGYLCIFNTPGLAAAVSRDHVLSGCSFTPGLDRNVFHPRPEPRRGEVKNVFFYGRPGVPRNGFELGMAGLHLIAERCPDSRLYVAGHHSDYPNLSARAEFLGYLRYEETGHLYRLCDVVLGFMFTPHPSYIPLQAMACGAVPVAVRNPYIEWILKDGVNSLLVRPSPLAIADAFEALRGDRELAAVLSRNALESVATGFDWQDEMDRIHEWMLAGAPSRLGVGGIPVPA